MRLIHALFGVAIALSGLACSARSEEEIYDPKGESAGAGFVDVDLRIDAMDCASWQECTVSASGSFQGRPVAIEATIRARGGQGRITYRSVGAASDALVQALAMLYKLPRNDATFAGTVTADLILLDANTRRMAGKVFFAARGPDSDYAELYTNVDKHRRILEIHEKDPEYRKNVLKALSP